MCLYSIVRSITVIFGAEAISLCRHGHLEGEESVDVVHLLGVELGGDLVATSPRRCELELCRRCRAWSYGLERIRGKFV